MFKGAQTMGALPKTGEHVYWLPVDYAGRSISELVHRADAPQSTVYHIVDPLPTSWDEDILGGLRDAGLVFEAVDKNEYVRRLEASEQDPVKNPIIKLLVSAHHLSELSKSLKPSNSRSSAPDTRMHRSEHPWSSLRKTQGRWRRASPTRRQQLGS